MDKDALRAEMTTALASLWEAGEMFHNAGLLSWRDDANDLAAQVKKFRDEFDLSF